MPEPSDRVIAIIVAGGAGKRFGASVPKQFLALAGSPLLLHTVRAFEQADTVDRICLVVPAGEEARAKAWRLEYGLEKLSWVVAGGGSRQTSVQSGFKVIPECEIVLVHDGARPLVDPSLVRAVVKETREKGACVPGLPVQETLKKVATAGHVIATVDRVQYATIQTPQGFRYPILAEALAAATADRFVGTDEAMLVERVGFPVSVIPGTADNIKVTTRQDWAIAEALLARRGGA